MDMQIKKNTVSARNQLPKKEYVTFIGDVNADMKIAFVGNSITRHGEAPQIGWNHNFGMAASAIENDYVHRVIHKLEEKYDSVSACVCNAFQWKFSSLFICHSRDHKNTETHDHGQYLQKAYGF